MELILRIKLWLIVGAVTAVCVGIVVGLALLGYFGVHGNAADNLNHIPGHGVIGAIVGAFIGVVIDVVLAYIAMSELPS